MSGKPTVSVILPTHNRGHLIARTIRSVLEQSLTEWELIVVDDGSTDDTEAVVREFGDPRITYLRRKTNGGAPAARNIGIRWARAEFLAFLDSDNTWHPTKLARQLTVFRQSRRTRLAVVTCGYRVVGRHGSSVRRPTTRGRAFDDVLRRRGVWDTNTLLVRREGTPEYLFDEELPAYQDFDYVARIVRDFELDYVDDVLVTSYMDDEGARVSDRNLDGRLHILNKYAAELQARPETLSHHHVRIGLKYYYQSNMSGARNHLWRAALAYPVRLQHWLWLSAAYLGPSAMWFAMRAFRHETTR